ncbi:MAG TPA: hypothetical protein EYP10_02285, partial [Armatimonadetes bacterium]|nr:hypothetical protein [Armatimonadota bacterium]
MSERTSITPPIGQTAQVGYPCASRELGACVDMRDRFWVTWVSHLNGRDTIMARRWSDADAELTVQVSEATGEFINPSAIGMPHGILFLWRSYHDDGWRIRARALYNEEWRDEIEIAIPQHSISAFAVTRDANDEIWLMMATHGNGESSVWCSKGVGDDWSEPTFAFSHRGRIDRLRIASSANALWLAWDCYCDGFFHIWVSCNSDGVWEQPHSVSQVVATGDEWHLVPTIACDASGMPFVAWLMPMPVADNLGAYDHWLWLMCARYDGKRWLPITDEKVARLLPGCVESLAQGLLASETYVGYHGRRRHPMLIADERCGMWLLWERKPREDFDTAKWGVLCAKFYDGEQWHEPIELHRGALCYQVDEATVVKDGKL